MNYTPAEQARHREEWVAALRSGDYTQANGRLRALVNEREGTFQHCCLGVACDISGLGEWRPDNRYLIDVDGAPPESEATHLPERAQEYFGIASDNGELIGTFVDVRGTCLTDANDTGSTFDEIADAIESGCVRVLA